MFERRTYLNFFRRCLDDSGRGSFVPGRALAGSSPCCAVDSYNTNIVGVYVSPIGLLQSNPTTGPYYGDERVSILRQVQESGCWRFRGCPQYPKSSYNACLADHYNTAALSATSRRYQEPRLFSARGFARDIPYGDEVASYIQDCVRVWKSSESIRFWRRHHRIAFASNTSGDATLSGNQCPPCELGGEASRCESLPIDEGVVPVLSSALVARQLWFRTPTPSRIAVEFDIILSISIADV